MHRRLLSYCPNDVPWLHFTILILCYEMHVRRQTKHSSKFRDVEGIFLIFCLSTPAVAIIGENVISCLINTI